MNPTPSKSWIRRFRENRLKACVCLGSLGVFFIFTELLARIVSGVWFSNLLEREIDLMKSAYPVQYDAMVGWVPQAGFSGDRNIWRTQVTITDDTLRSNGPAPPGLTGRPILAVGDSYTFGDEVEDRATWPAHLERLLQRPVRNAGVFGYGIDQMVLRARQLIPQVRPEWVILSFIPGDIGRGELSVRGASKPYYRMVHGVPVLEQQPVPPPEPVQLDPFRRVGGHSWVVHLVMQALAPSYWYEGRGKRIKVHDEGEAVAAAVLRIFAQELANQNLRMLIVCQDQVRLRPEMRQQAVRVLAALRGAPVEILDLYPELMALRDDNPRKFQSYYTGLTRGHMTEAGNAWVAKQIASKLTQVSQP